MSETEDITLPAFRYLSCESETVCRLCFGSTDGGVELDESRLLQCYYFDDCVTFYDMFAYLGIILDNSLPPMLCAYCADATINSFLFKKLCHYSTNQWLEALDKFNRTLDLSETLSPTVKTAYFLLQNEHNLILTSRKLHQPSKEGAQLKIKDLLKARQTYEKVKKKTNVICEECGEKFPTKVHLAKHMRVHSNVKHPCKHCPKIYPSVTQLRGHLERIHKPKTIQCTKCAKMFSTEKMLKHHDTTHHIAAICKKCFVQFPSRKDLMKHMDKHGVNKCARCDKEFSTKVTYKIHMKICGDNKKHLKFYCDICNKGYARKNGLRSHIVTDHGYGRVYNCNWCNKPFDAISKLKNHIVKHTRERNFHCEQCGGQFVTQAALVYHIRIHTGERPFPCDICDESFLSASRRMEHKKRKHFGPSRECHICHNKFVTGNELQKHIARHKNPQSRLFVSENEVESNTSQKHIIYF